MSTSGIAYTAARLNQMSSLLYVEDRGLPRPDLTFLLYLSGGTLESRLPPNPETGESRAFQDEVYRYYLHLLDPSYHMLDGDASEISIFHRSPSVGPSSHNRLPWCPHQVF